MDNLQPWGDCVGAAGVRISGTFPEVGMTNIFLAITKPFATLIIVILGALVPDDV